MSSRRTHRTTVLTLVSAMLLSFSGLAIADVTVSVSLEDGDRDMVVTDLANQPLTDLALRHGVPATFRVGVIDDRLNRTQQGDFSVDATMNNLYRFSGDTPDLATMIPSSQVSVSYATDLVAINDVLADLLPTYLLSMDEALNCSALASLLGLSLSDLLGLLGLGSLGLCDAIDGLTFSDLPVAGALLADVDLSDLGLPALPLVPSRGDSGEFLVADYTAGIGAGHEGPGSDQTPTVKRLLVGEMADSLDVTALTDLLIDLLEELNLPLVAQTGDALTSANDVVDALVDSGNTEIAALGDILSRLSSSDRITVITSHLTSTIGDLGLDDILALSGSYYSLPRLTVNTDDALSGVYQGTLILTLSE